MTGALLYLQACSLKNLVWLRIRRLRRPKYLFGAIFGAAYFGVIFVRPFFMVGRPGAAMPFSGLDARFGEFIAAGALLLLVSLAWLLPQKRTGLVFSEAEIAFLFPAPVSRAALIRFKLAKSQLGILTTVIFLSLLSVRFGGLAAAGRRAAGLWMILSIINLHSLGVSFTQQFALGKGVSTWRRRLIFLGVAVGAVGGVGTWAALNLPALRPPDFRSVDAVIQSVRLVIASPPAVVLLAPFRAVVRPFLAADGRSFLLALGPAAALLALHYLWVVRMDVAFEESSIEASRRHAARVAALRGNRLGAGRPRRKSRAPFSLSPTGRPAVAFLWKNLLGAGQLFSLRVWLPVLLWGLLMGYLFQGHSHRSPWLPILGTAAIFLAGISVLIGPQIARQDFRQDLAAVDLLKTYPISGRQMAFGQILTPLVILTGFQWLSLGAGAILLQGAHAGAGGPGQFAGCLAIVAPAFNLVMLSIPNAAALLYPGWFRAAQTGRRDLEVTGQRMLFSVAVLAIFALAMAPAAGVFGLAYLVAAPLLLPTAAALPFSALSAAAVLAAEGVAGVAALGYLFERFDPSAETT